MTNKTKIDKILFIIYYIGIACILAYAFIAYKYFPENWRLNPLFIFFGFSLLLYLISMGLQIKKKKPLDLLILILMIIGIAFYCYREGIYVWF